MRKLLATLSCLGVMASGIAAANPAMARTAHDRVTTTCGVNKVTTTGGESARARQAICQSLPVVPGHHHWVVPPGKKVSMQQPLAADCTVFFYSAKLSDLIFGVKFGDHLVTWQCQLGPTDCTMTDIGAGVPPFNVGYQPVSVPGFCGVAGTPGFFYLNHPVWHIVSTAFVGLIEEAAGAAPPMP
jgi:hypothetical protein